MSKKKVILAMPELFKIHELIIENLEKCGFEVLSLTYEEKEFKYKKCISTAEKKSGIEIFLDKKTSKNGPCSAP